MTGPDFKEDTRTDAIDVSGLLDLIVEVAVMKTAGVTGASISVRLGRGEFETTHASSPGIRAIDEAQYKDGAGPCVKAIQTGEETLVCIPVAEWEAFSARALEAGVRAVWSLPLKRGDGAASLNLYSATRGGWDPAGMAAARRLAGHAASVWATADALANARSVNQRLLQALDSRDRIGQAKGILMAREAVGADEAFDILRRASQRTNRKLVDIAADILRSANPDDRS